VKSLIIEDVVKFRRKNFRKKDGKVYTMYFVSFSVKYSEVLKRFKELQNVEIITDRTRLTLPKVNLFQYSYYLNRSTGEKIPQFSFVIPKVIGEKMDAEGVRKVKIIVEIPEATLNQ